VADRFLMQNAQTAWRVYDGEAVIIGPDSTLNTLNPVGTLIWQAADGKTPLSAIVTRICAEFEVEPVRAQRDSAAFVEQLCQRGLLTLLDSPHEGPEEERR
jgi:coenzyme PQQ synthesis protein D (PqqD)